MKKLSSIKFISLVLTVILVTAVFGACGTSFDAGTFVKGSIDSTYLGTWDEAYLDIIVDTEEDLKESYESGLKVEADYFISYFDLAQEYVTEEMYQEIIDIYKEIYSHLKFEVGAVAKGEDYYTVTVTIHPIDIIKKINENDSDAFYAAWDARWENGDFEEMSDEEFEHEWAREILDLVKSKLPTIGYLEPETIAVQVVLEGAGKEQYYTIAQNDFERIDELIIKY